MSLEPPSGIGPHVVRPSLLPAVQIEDLLHDELARSRQARDDRRPGVARVGPASVGEGGFEHVQVAVSVAFRPPQEAEGALVQVRGRGEEAEGVVEVDPGAFLGGPFHVEGGGGARLAVEHDEGEGALSAVQELDDEARGVDVLGGAREPLHFGEIEVVAEHGGQVEPHGFFSLACCRRINYSKLQQGSRKKYMMEDTAVNKRYMFHIYRPIGL
mmetsp:Transcript_7464/g.16173  ORF Transcript_7464/g.16173 Transcript_7464/m.16173 type:complete len:214 (+) Transcript_7464:858-1499(+)